jgi:hypothetical protein
MFIRGFVTDEDKVPALVLPGEFVIYYKCLEKDIGECETFVKLGIMNAGLTIR